MPAHEYFSVRSSARLAVIFQKLPSSRQAVARPEILLDSEACAGRYSGPNPKGEKLSSIERDSLQDKEVIRHTGAVLAALKRALVL
jgi:hypothetical protein